MITILCDTLNLSLPLCISPQYSPESHRFRFIFSHSIFSLIFMVFQTKTNAIVQLFLIWFLRFLCSWDCLKIFNLQVWTLLSTRSHADVLLSCASLYFQQTTFGSRSEHLPHLNTYLPWNLTAWLYKKIWYVTGVCLCQSLLWIGWCSQVSEWNRQW